MLWLKSWLECRSRLILCIGTGTVMLWSCWVQIPPEIGLSAAQLDPVKLEKFWKAFVLLVGAILFPIGALILAGSGVSAQTSMGMMRGFHPSTYFLLGLPVQRERLLRVRFIVGAGLLAFWMLLTVAIHYGLAAWYRVPLDWVRTMQTFPHMYLVSLLAFSLATWLSSFLDEIWSGSIGLMIFGALAGYSLAGGKTWFNLGDFCFQAQLFTNNPLIWLRAGFYLVICGLFYAAARYVVERKEY